MRRTSICLIIAASVIACDRADAPFMPDLGGPAAEIVDAAHNLGNPHFYFLPPIVPAPAPTGDFDGALEPVVEICEGTDCATPLARYTTTTGPGSQTVRVVADGEHYIVNWHTDQFSLDATKIYRIRVTVDGLELGHADIAPVNSGKDLKNVDTGDVLALVDGRTLPIKFRIEQGIVTGLVSWWPGDQTARDAVGGNDGTLWGDAAYAPGLAGDAFSFGGTGGHAAVPNSPSLNPTNALTIEFWVRPDPSNAMDGCCQGLVMTDFYGLEIADHGAPGAIMFVGTDLNWTHSADGEGNGYRLTPGKWQHLAGTYDGQWVKLYANGMFVEQAPSSGLIVPMLENTDFGPSYLSIGSEDGRKNEPDLTGQRYFHGLIDDVRLYDRALSADEIAAAYGRHGALAEALNAM